MTRYPIAFARFWYDFIVGDSITLAIGGPVVLAIAFVLARNGAERLAEVAIPLAVAATFTLSLRQKS